MYIFSKNKIDFEEIRIKDYYSFLEYRNHGRVQVHAGDLQEKAE